MRIIFFFFILLFFVVPNLSYASDVIVSSDLKAVTIYSANHHHGARAKLTRQGKVQLKPGKHILVFQNMPANLLTDSLRAKGEGTARVILGALSNKIVNNTEYVSEREQVLNTEKKTLEQQKQVEHTKEKLKKEIKLEHFY